MAGKVLGSTMLRHRCYLDAGHEPQPWLANPIHRCVCGGHWHGDWIKDDVVGCGLEDGCPLQPPSPAPFGTNAPMPPRRETRAIEA